MGVENPCFRDIGYFVSLQNQPACEMHVLIHDQFFGKSAELFKLLFSYSRTGVTEEKCFNTDRQNIIFTFDEGNIRIVK
jgi:hypothetical protein